MATPTVSSIKTVLEGITYPANTITNDVIYDFRQVRKRYPSIEIELAKPESFRETKERTETTYTFTINFYHKVLGLGGDEVSTSRTIEDLIITELQGASLGDHKIITESLEWSRTYPDKKHPYFVLSTLNLSVSRVLETTITADGVLEFQQTGSEVDNNPGTDVIYLNVYDVEISEGYGTRNEFVSSNPKGKNIPIRYSTGFRGRFIGHLHLDKANIGTTGEAINQLMTLRSNGEKPFFKYKYTNFDSNTPPNTITETAFVELDELSRLYAHRDLIRYRITGTLTEPSTIT